MFPLSLKIVKSIHTKLDIEEGTSYATLSREKLCQVIFALEAEMDNLYDQGSARIADDLSEVAGEVETFIEELDFHAAETVDMMAEGLWDNPLTSDGPE